MLVYVNIDKNIIVGTHFDTQEVDPLFYGENIRVIPMDYSRSLRPGTTGPAATRPLLHKYAEFKSRKLQAKGVKVGEFTVPTDNPGELSHIKQAFDSGHLQLTMIKMKDGKFLQASGELVDRMHEAVANHRSRCRYTESAVEAKIVDGQITTYDQIDSLFSEI